MTANTAQVIAHLLPDLVPGVDFIVEVGVERTGAPGNYQYQQSERIVWNSVTPQPTEAEIDAARPSASLTLAKTRLKGVATLHGLQYANTSADPLTGVPISSASDADSIRRHTWTAEQYWKVADGLTQAEIDAQWPNASATAHADIATVRSLQDTLRGITLTIHAEIDAITDEVNLPTENDITTDPRWP